MTGNYFSAAGFSPSGLAFTLTLSLSLWTFDHSPWTAGCRMGPQLTVTKKEIATRISVKIRILRHFSTRLTHVSLKPAWTTIYGSL